MKSIQEISEQNFIMFDEVYNKLSAFFVDNKKLLLAVSGGPDSMFLAVLIYNFFVDNKLDIDNLFFVHCNHKTRSETDNEQIFVEEFFKGLNLYVCTYDKSISKLKTEKNLRDWRYGEFQNIIDQNDIDFLLTGHNLTDRIESSFMNMFRGAGLNGFSSMKFVDQNNLLSGVDIVRPLLGYTKSEIEKFCDKYGIKFAVDPTNLDQETSLRNKIRLSLFPQFALLSNKSNVKTNSFFDSMRQIYSEIDDIDSAGDIGHFVEIKQSGYRNSDFAFLRDVPLGFISNDILLKVFKKFNISSGIKTETLDDCLSFFQTSKQGYKYINGVYFFLSHEKIYIIKAKQNFWEKHIEKSLIIDKLGDIDIGKNSVSIDDAGLIGLELRYPKQGDKFGSKSWGKYCINHKIPVFWRNFIPVVIDTSKSNIIKYFK